MGASDRLSSKVVFRGGNVPYNCTFLLKNGPSSNRFFKNMGERARAVSWLELKKKEFLHRLKRLSASTKVSSDASFVEP
jgi:hypothetical protein